MQDLVIKDLLRDYPNLTEIPFHVLEERGAKMLEYQVDKFRKIYQIVMTKDFDNLSECCSSTLSACEGYIFAHDLCRIYRHLNEQEMIDSDRLSRVARQAKNFREAGIPPIFKRHFYTESHFQYLDVDSKNGRLAEQTEELFPATDFIIQFATGSYDRRRSAIAIRLRNVAKIARPAIPIQPTTVQDVRDFRSMAFDTDGRISPLLIRETHAYIRDKFDIQSDDVHKAIFDRNTTIFRSLEEELQNIPHEAPQYTTWDGNTQVVAEPRWYLKYEPSQRNEIARAYFSQVSSQPKQPKGKEWNLFLKMKELFPELTTTRWQTNPQLNKQIKLSLLISSFRDMCEQRMQTPEILLLGSDSLCTHVPFNKNLMSVFEFREVLAEIRLKALEKMTDDQFRSVYGCKSGTSNYASLGRHTLMGEASIRFRTSFTERYLRIFGTDDQSGVAQTKVEGNSSDNPNSSNTKSEAHA